MAGGGNMKVTGSNPTQHSQPTGGDEKLSFKEGMQEIFPHMSFSDVKELKAKTVKPHNTPEGNHKTTQREEKVSFSIKGLKEAFGKLIDKIVAFFKSSSKGDEGKVDGGKIDQQPQVNQLPKKKSSDMTSDEAFSFHMAKLGSSDPKAFLRENNTYSREIREKVEKTFDSGTLTGSVQLDAYELSLINNFDRASVTIDVTLNSADTKQSEHFAGIAKSELNNFLGTGENSLLSKVPQDVRTTLKERAEQIMDNPNLSKQQQNDGVRLLYKDAIFLKGFSSIIADHLTNEGLRQSDRDVELGNSLALAVLNGVTKPTKFSPELQKLFPEVRQIFVDKFDTAMMSIGMPDLENR